MIEEFASDFFAGVREAMAEVQLRDVRCVVQALQQAYRDGNTVFIMGNGGSAASASHLACDLSYAEGKRNRFRVVCLTDSVPLLTALSNDLGYEEVFGSQLEQLLGAGDVMIVLSVSGDSKNIVQAAQVARRHDAVSIGFLGSKGGRMQDLLDHCVTMSSSDFPVVESAHCVLMQMVASAFRRCIAE